MPTFNRPLLENSLRAEDTNSLTAAHSAMPRFAEHKNTRCSCDRLAYASSLTLSTAEQRQHALVIPLPTRRTRDGEGYREEGKKKKGRRGGEKGKKGEGGETHHFDIVPPTNRGRRQTLATSASMSHNASLPRAPRSQKMESGSFLHRDPGRTESPLVGKVDI